MKGGIPKVARVLLFKVQLLMHVLGRHFSHFMPFRMFKFVDALGEFFPFSSLLFCCKGNGKTASFEQR
jgi:hypothetical protein